MTFRQLHLAMKQFITDHPDHEALDRQVVVRLEDDEYLYVGGLRSAVVDAGCTDDFMLVLDADQEVEEEEAPDADQGAEEEGDD